MKKTLTLAATLLGAISCHAASIEPYVRHQNLSDSYSDTDAVGVRLQIPDVGPVSSFVVGLESKRWKGIEPDSSGTSVDAAAYYNLGASWWGATQVQLGSSALYPRSTLYQEFNYRAGPSGNLALGVGGGYQDFWNSGSTGFVTLGPIYYFSGGNIGYKYTDYSAAGNWMQALTGEAQLSSALSVSGALRGGVGAYTATVINGLPTRADVQTREWELGLRYHPDGRFEWMVKVGGSQVDDRPTGQRMYRTQDVTLGVKASW